MLVKKQTFYRFDPKKNKFLYNFPKDAALVSEKTSITYTVLIIKGEQTIKCN